MLFSPVVRYFSPERMLLSGWRKYILYIRFHNLAFNIPHFAEKLKFYNATSRRKSDREWDTRALHGPISINPMKNHNHVV